MVSGNQECVQTSSRWHMKKARDQMAWAVHCSACLTNLLQLCAGHSLNYGEEASCRYDLLELEAGLYVQDKILLVHSHITEKLSRCSPINYGNQDLRAE